MWLHFSGVISERLVNTLLMRDIKQNSHKGQRLCWTLPSLIVHAMNTVGYTLGLAYLLTWLIAVWKSLAFRARYYANVLIAPVTCIRTTLAHSCTRELLCAPIGHYSLGGSLSSLA